MSQIWVKITHSTGTYSVFLENFFMDRERITLLNQPIPGAEEYIDMNEVERIRIDTCVIYEKD